MEFLFNASTAALIVFGLLSAVDGVYLHLCKFRLYARSESRKEHVIHTLRALLFVPALLFVLEGSTRGPLLWAGVAVVVIDSAVAAWDVVTEGKSREFQGGLPRSEFVLHGVLTSFHLAAIALSLAARPAAAWLPGSTIAAQTWAARHAHSVVMWGMLPGAVAVAMLHILLLAPSAQRAEVPLWLRRLG